MNPILDFNDQGGVTIEIPQIDDDYSLVVNHWKSADIQQREIEQDILQSDSLQRTNFLKKYAEELRQMKEQFQEHESEKECEKDDDISEEEQFLESNMEYDKRENCLSINHSKLKHSLAWYLMNCVGTEFGKIENEIEKQKGILIACDKLDTTIQIIRASASPYEAAMKLIKHFSLSKLQAKGIVYMRLRQLTGANFVSIKNYIIFLENQIAFLEKLKV